MRDRFVIDASVVVKWFIEEEGSERAEQLLDARVDLYAPRILLGEVANALWKSVRRGEVPMPLAEEALRRLPRTIRFLFDTDDILTDVLQMAVALDHPIYDCLYVAGARRRELSLVTADARLIRKFSASPYASTILPLSEWRA
ncbi:type II toxin-antitoxin system VapC family toxin [Xanthobacter tagetidis]|jgi:predicted nucleic acid-binding protein|uniref:PIN domain-containing protein n=1 Tax=Xanthobacter tagetidis TaxID=60216 RepID=A0A3L7AFV9_9HYPH|nr:type II toxin-antitoxin system VapC family toxin [Xanthobacter tagetidis]MBB6306529.1 hypothetical protein [Xanthobacter tagetidis]RLP79137.1 PIN domain-containing protein [Xanthobacter tagetidis]